MKSSVLRCLRHIIINALASPGCGNITGGNVPGGNIRVEQLELQDEWRLRLLSTAYYSRQLLITRALPLLYTSLYSINTLSLSLETSIRLLHLLIWHVAPSCLDSQVLLFHSFIFCFFVILPKFNLDYTFFVFEGIRS